MKVKVYVIDLEIPPRVKKWSLRLALPLAVLIVGGVAYADLPHPSWQDGDTLTAKDLTQNFQYLQGELATLQGQVTGTWTAFTPIVTSDGTAASVQLLNFSYSQVGKTVFIRGVAVFGYTAAGAGGTFIKVSLPLSGRTGTQQDGIGTVLPSYAVTTAPGTYRPGWGRIVAGDEGNVLLTDPAGNIVNGSATLGFGFSWVVDCAYESN